MYRCIPQIKYSKKDINTRYFDHYPVVKYKDCLVSCIYLYISVYICLDSRATVRATVVCPPQVTRPLSRVPTLRQQTSHHAQGSPAVAEMVTHQNMEK